jgi:hypothetical protein
MKVSSFYSTLNRTLYGEIKYPKIGGSVVTTIACLSLFATPKIFRHHKGLQSQKWKILTLAIFYVLTKREKIKKNLPIQLNLPEIILSPLSALSRSVKGITLGLHESTRTKKESLTIITSALFISCYSLSLFKKVKFPEKPLIHFNKNIIATLSLFSKVILISKIGKFSCNTITNMVDLEKKKGLSADLLLTILNSFWDNFIADEIFRESPLLLKASFIQRQAYTLSFLLEKTAKIYKKFLLETELTAWEEQVLKAPSEEDQQSRIKSVVNKISKSINQENNSLSVDLGHSTQIPSVIWKLNHIRRLNLVAPLLTELPRNIGQLENLEALNISDCTSLENLPEELKSLFNLRGIYTNKTRIPLSRVNEILETLTQRRRRRRDLVNQLSRVPKKWKDILSIQDNSLDFIDLLGERKKNILINWIRRVEKTPEFKSSKEEVVKIVSDILITVNEKPDFSRDFFSHTETNNIACEDHAGMALNEIYTMWRLVTLDKESSLKDKVKLLIRAAKTHYFRYYLAEWIQKNEPDNKESVEIFLFYEILVKKDLDLLSVLKIMKHKKMGDKRSQLSKRKVIADVNNSYSNSLFSIPDFEKLLEDDSSFQNMWNEQKGLFHKELENLIQKELGSNEFNIENNRIMKKQKEAKKETAVKWLIQKGFIPL